MKNYECVCLMNLICSHMNHNPEIYSSVSIYLAILKYTSFFSICINLELTSYTSITEGTVKFWLKQAYQWGLFEEKYQSIVLLTSIARIHSLQHRCMAHTVWAILYGVRKIFGNSHSYSRYSDIAGLGMGLSFEDRVRRIIYSGPRRTVTLVKSVVNSRFSWKLGDTFLRYRSFKNSWSPYSRY